MTAALLHEISHILVSPAISRESARTSLAAILMCSQENRFESPLSRINLYRALSAAAHLLNDLLPHALEILRRGAKGFTTEVSQAFVHGGIALDRVWPFSAQTESGKEALLRLSSKLVVLCQRDPNPQLLKIVSTLHMYLLTLGRYDPSWTIRSLTRMYAGLGSVIKIPSPQDEVSEATQLEQDAFASGEAIAVSAPLIAEEDQESHKIASAIQTAILGSSSQSRQRHQHNKTVQLERLAGWQTLPEWPEKAPQHNLRNSTVEAPAPSVKAYRGFGNSPSSSASTSRSTSQRDISRHKQTGKRKAENVILVPTESTSPPLEKSRPVGLQAFLESSEEGEEMEETESESETETETDSDNDAVTAETQKVGPVPESDSDSDSGEEISTSDEDDSGNEVDVRAPLAR